MVLSPLLFHRVLEVPAKQSGKKKKGKTRIGKEEVKLCLFADHMILYPENPKDSTKYLLDFTGHKIYIQKSIVFLHTNKFSEKKMKKSI